MAQNMYLHEIPSKLFYEEISVAFAKATHGTKGQSLSILKISCLIPELSLRTLYILMDSSIWFIQQAWEGYL